MSTTSFGVSFDDDRKYVFSITEPSRNRGLEGAFDEVGFSDRFVPLQSSPKSQLPSSVLGFGGNWRVYDPVKCHDGTDLTSRGRLGSDYGHK